MGKQAQPEGLKERRKNAPVKMESSVMEPTETEKEKEVVASDDYETTGLWDKFGNAAERIYHPYIEPILYPLTPSTVPNMITLVFWHSFILTVTTPLARIIYGEWMGVSTIHMVLNKIGLGGILPFNGHAHGHSLFVYKTTPTVDKAFGLHAFFGLLWLVCAYLQMGPIRVRSLALHRKFGYFALLTFFGHIGASLYNLYQDEAQHHTLTQMLLTSPVLLAPVYIIHGIVYAKRHDTQHHIDSSVTGFLYSIEGAGTIRTIAQLQDLFKPYLSRQFGGLAECQHQHEGRATNCVVPYVTRLLMIRWITMYWIGMYAKIKGDKKFTKVFLLEAIVTCSSSVVMMTLLGQHEIKTLYAEMSWLDQHKAMDWTLFIMYQVLFIQHMTVPLFQVEAKEKYARRTYDYFMTKVRPKTTSGLDLEERKKKIHEEFEPVLMAHSRTVGT